MTYQWPTITHHHPPPPTPDLYQRPPPPTAPDRPRIRALGTTTQPFATTPIHTANRRRQTTPPSYAHCPLAPRHCSPHPRHCSSHLPWYPYLASSRTAPTSTNHPCSNRLQTAGGQPGAWDVDGNGGRLGNRRRVVPPPGLRASPLFTCGLRPVMACVPSHRTRSNGLATVGNGGLRQLRDGWARTKPPATPCPHAVDCGGPGGGRVVARCS